MNFFRKPFPLLRRPISSKIPSRKPYPLPLPPPRSLFSGSISNPSLYSTKKLFSAGSIPNPSSQWHRFYHLDRRQPQHWYHKPRTLLIVIVFSGGAIITICYGNFETVPCTKRSHFILLSPSYEQKLGEHQFQELKNDYKGKILPPKHPDRVRVRRVATKIVKSLRRGLKYANPSSVPQTLHLEGLKWEVLVVRDKDVNAFCLPGGKIVVFTGLLDHFKTDAEIATVLGHEVAHVIARHGAEMVTKNLCFVVIRLMLLLQFLDMFYIIDAMSPFLLQPFSRRMEIEADYVGLLLMASAGYDPRVAPRVYEKLGQIMEETLLDDYISTHPSSRRRANLLSQAQVMDEALSLYGDAVAGHVVSALLMS